MSAPASRYHSPKLPALLQRRPASSSSDNSSPLQSPSPFAHAAYISGGDSPQKEHFTLPPPAYPHNAHHHGTSTPVKIQPMHVHRPVIPVPGHTGTTPGSFGGQSTDTIRYGRRPAVTNSMKSPNAIGPRCACGLPAGHAQRVRGTSKDRAGSFGNVLDSPGGFTMLATLSGQRRPSLTALQLEETLPRSSRHTSDSAIHPSGILGLHHQALPVPRRSSPPAGPSSYLSRSRSDPLPPSAHSPRAHATLSSLVANLRLSNANPTEALPHVGELARKSLGAHPLPATATPIFSKRRLSDETDSRLNSPVNDEPASSAGDLARSVSDRRGRSRDRHALNLDENGAIVPSNYGLNLREGRSRSGSNKREQAPSRTRRSGEFPAPRGRNAEWPRRPSTAAEDLTQTQGIAPKSRSVVPPNAGVVAPPPSAPHRLRDSPRQPSLQGESFRLYPDRAAQELSRVFGVAAS